MGVVTANAIQARRSVSRRDVQRRVDHRKRTSPEEVARRSRIRTATRAGRAANKAKAEAERRLAKALNQLVAEDMNIREAADRIGVSYHRTRQILRPTGAR